jgi:tyrosinase
MGGNGDPDNNNIVNTGPFKDWITVEADQHGDPIGKGRLRRTLGVEIPRLPTQTDVYNAFNFDFYDTPYWDRSSVGFRSALEGFYNRPQLHNRVHIWVGGSMYDNTSPNDPIFFLNHCNVDRIWVHWQAIRSDHGYPMHIKDRNCEPIGGMNLNDYMFPWDDKDNGTTIASVLDHRKLKYIYDK